MKFLVATAYFSDEYGDGPSFAILEINKEFVEKMTHLFELTKTIPEANYISFRTHNFYFVDYKLSEEYPELHLDEQPFTDDCVCFTDIDLSYEALEDKVGMPRVDCEFVKIYPNISTFTFTAYDKYNSDEYWFEVSLEEIKATLEKEVSE